MTGINLSNTYYFLRREKDRDIARINDTHHEYTVRSHYEHYFTYPPSFTSVHTYLRYIYEVVGIRKFFVTLIFMHIHNTCVGTPYLVLSSTSMFHVWTRVSDPDQRESEKLDPDLNKSQNSEAFKTHNGAVEGLECEKWRRGGFKWRPVGSVGQWLKICITLISRIRIRIEVKSSMWIRIKVKNWIRIHIKVIRIRNPGMNKVVG